MASEPAEARLYGGRSLMSNWFLSLPSFSPEFPPRLPDGWEHTMPFSITKRMLREGGGGPPVSIVAGIKGFDLPRHYRVVTRDMVHGRMYWDADGTRYVGVSPYKHPDPPGFFDFEVAVRVAEAVLDGTIPSGIIVPREPDGLPR